MRYITLKDTDLSLSALSMGTVYYGSRISDADSFAALDAFYAKGGNFLDTARVYADWLADAPRQSSEKCLGRWLKSRGLQEKVIVATKGGHPPLNDMSSPTLSLTELTAQVDDSRRNLGLDALPLYYLHRDDPRLPVGQIMDAVFTLADQGAVRYFACSNWTAERIRQANAYAASCGRTGFVAVSNQWSLARHNPGVGDPTMVYTDDAMLAFHRESGLPLIPYTSMAQGALSKIANGTPLSKGLEMHWGSPENAAIVRRAQVLAQQKNATVAQIAQCFFYAQDFQVIPAVSFSNAAQLEEALAAADMTLTKEEAHWLLHG